MLTNLDNFFSSLSSVVWNDNGITIFGLAIALEIICGFIYLIFRIIRSFIINFKESEIKND